MSALESLIAAGGEAPLLESLTYDIPPASSAVTMRKQGVRAYPTSASTLSPAGVRTVRIRLGGNDWFDPASLRLVYTIQNTDANANLCPSCGPWGPFGLVRLLSGGVELDNIPMYHRHHELHGWRLSTMEEQAKEGVFGWASAWTNQTVAGNTPHPNQGYLAPTASLTVSFKPLLSVFTSGKAIPCRYMPLELELTLAPATEWTNALDYAQNPQAASRAHTIGNIQLMYDSLVLDEAVQESFYKSLLSNRVLSIPTTLFTQVVQTIPNAVFSSAQPGSPPPESPQRVTGVRNVKLVATAHWTLGARRSPPQRVTTNRTDCHTLGASAEAAPQELAHRTNRNHPWAPAGHQGSTQGPKRAKHCGGPQSKHHAFTHFVLRMDCLSSSPVLQ